jgi:cystathionine beta-synthase
MDIRNNILETIGNTPLIKLNKVCKDFPCTVLAKVDYFNPGNSIKDRMAVKMVEMAEKEGKLSQVELLLNVRAAIQEWG